jgi:hypothetical protein
MRYLLPIFLAVLLGASPSLRAQASTEGSDIYLNAYLAVQDAAKMQQEGNLRGALSKYQLAMKGLEAVKREYPKFSPDIVSFRMQQTAEAIDALSKRVSSARGESPEPTLPVKDDDPLGLNQRQGGSVPPSEPINLPVRRGSKEPAARNTTSQPPEDPSVDIEKRVTRLVADLKAANAAAAQAKEDKEKLVEQYNTAVKARAVAEEKQQMLQSRADNAEARLLKEQQQTKVDTNKVRALQAEADEAKRVLKAAKIDDEAEIEVRKQLKDRLQAAADRIAKLQAATKEGPQKIQLLQTQLDKANAEKQELTQKLANTENKLQAVTNQRDDAMKQLTALKEAAKNVDKLVTENAALMARLQDAEKQVATFRAEGEEKDKQIAALKKEVGTVKDQLAQVRSDSAAFQRQMGDLQAKLDEQSKQLTQAKAETAASNADKKKMVAENEILRGIVQRQQLQEARRSATKKVVLAELAKLETKSKTLLKDIEFLSQPVVKLTPKELALFKNSPPIMEISGNEIITSKTSDDPALPTAIVPDGTAGVESKEPETAMPDKPAITLDPPAIDPGGPMASLPTGVPDLTPGESLPKTSPTTDPGSNDSLPAPQETLGSGNTPNIPAEFLPLARDGKEFFEKGKYREAEKIYEQILAKVPNNLYILSNLGVVRFRAGKYKQAEEVLLKATKVAPEDSFSHCTLGIVYYTEQKFDDAVSSLGRALAINPKNATAHNYLGITAASKGWAESAQKELEAACTIDPRYADAHFNLAVVFATQTPPNREKARQYYKRATELGAEADSALEQMLKPGTN